MEVFGGSLHEVAVWFGAHGPLGLFLFLVLEEAGLPLLIPGDTLVMAAGMRTHLDPTATITILLTASLATALGSSILYWLVRRGGRPLLHRYGRYLHLTPGRVALLERWFQRHGAAAIVVGRLIPGLRTPTTVAAGLFRVPYRTFAPSTIAAGFIWTLTYFFLGALLERQWRLLAAAAFAHLQLLVAMIGAASLVAACIGLVQRRARLARARVARESAAQSW